MMPEKLTEEQFLKEHPSFKKFSDRKGFDVAINKDIPLQPQIDEFMKRFKTELRRQIHETQLDKQKVSGALIQLKKLFESGKIPTIDDIRECYKMFQELGLE